MGSDPLGLLGLRGSEGLRGPQGAHSGTQGIPGVPYGIPRPQGTPGSQIKRKHKQGSFRDRELGGPQPLRLALK